MLYAGLDLSRKRPDACLLTEEGEIVGEFGVPPDLDGLRGLIKRVGAVPVLAVIESMTGARFVHDRLEQLGWDVRIAEPSRVVRVPSERESSDSWPRNAPSLGPWRTR